MTAESDRLLIQQIRQGDSGAWDELIARSQPETPSEYQRAFLEQIVILWDAWSFALDRYQEGV